MVLPRVIIKLIYSLWRLPFLLSGMACHIQVSTCSWLDESCTFLKMMITVMEDCYRYPKKVGMCVNLYLFEGNWSLPVKPRLSVRILLTVSSGLGKRKMHFIARFLLLMWWLLTSSFFNFGSPNIFPNPRPCDIVIMRHCHQFYHQQNHEIYHTNDNSIT